MKSEMVALRRLFMPHDACHGVRLSGNRCAADRLHYAGSVGTGFSERVARELKASLDMLASQTPIISSLRIDKAVWCRPELKAEIAYRAVTRKQGRAAAREF